MILHKFPKKLAVLLCLSLFFQNDTHAQSSIEQKNAKNFTAYLFTYFGGSKDSEAIRFAVSDDGYSFEALNHNEPVISSKAISSTGGVRDPHILRGHDGKTFYMVVTDMVAANGWDSNRAMVLMKSKDLIHWTSSIVNIQKRFPENEDLLRVWAPQTIYDEENGKYMVYFSLKNGKNPDKIYYAYANKDFTDLETTPKQLFFSPTNGACIDGDIVEKDNKFYLFFKTESEGAGIKIAVSDRLTGDYVLRDRYVQQTKNKVEGAGVFKLNNGEGYILMYDMYTSGKYQFTKTTDFDTFKVIDEEVTMDFHPRHGTVIPITSAEKQRLLAKWGDPDELMLNPKSSFIRKQNIVFDTANRHLFLPLKHGAKLNALNPEFLAPKGTKIKPKGKVDFTNGPVNYTLNTKDRPAVNYSVSAKVYHNPVLDGYFADPDVIYSEKNKKFYMYPTSDGFTNWSGTYFKAFSSSDLINWKDEGVILDLKKDVKWADRNAWAPCIIERKINGAYKYFYYYTAAQKIGVATADDPAGPFVDSGKALIDVKPAGVKGGQVIDPDVFLDPKSGKYFLYWGNGFLAGAELNDDMISIKEETLKLLTPPKTFREGTHVLYRNGLYYFMWSENDTRDEDYRVRYGIADAPLSEIKIPQNNLVIAKNTDARIYATGHNSTIKIPGKDEWYLVYHRFTYPKGITMGRSAGYNREVCIDKLEFNQDGTIKQTIPTHEGIKAVESDK
jgi:sucrose-6-phosphate hydrolase SacC (GH32 family)